MRKLILLILVWMILAGCTGRPGNKPQATSKVVTSISVTYENGPLSTQLFYNTDEKMRPILHYLRWLQPTDNPFGDPEALSGSTIHMLVEYSDGSHRLFTQKSDLYFRVDNGLWKAIDPQKASTLSRILGQMASDPKQPKKR